MNADQPTGGRGHRYVFVGAHNVRAHAGGSRHYHHHVVGDLDLAYETMDLRSEPGLSMTIFTAEPG